MDLLHIQEDMYSKDCDDVHGILHFPHMLQHTGRYIFVWYKPFQEYILSSSYILADNLEDALYILADRHKLLCC